MICFPCGNNSAKVQNTSIISEVQRYVFDCLVGKKFSTYLDDNISNIDDLAYQAKQFFDTYLANSCPNTGDEYLQYCYTSFDTMLIWKWACTFIQEMR